MALLWLFVIKLTVIALHSGLQPRGNLTHLGKTLLVWILDG